MISGLTKCVIITPAMSMVIPYPPNLVDQRIANALDLKTWACIGQTLHKNGEKSAQIHGLGDVIHGTNLTAAFSRYVRHGETALRNKRSNQLTNYYSSSQNKEQHQIVNFVSVFSEALDLTHNCK